MPRNIVLITTAFPSSSVTEEVFVTPELEALAREFDRVIIVPMLLIGKVADINLPNVTVDYTIVRHLYSRFKPSKLPYLLSPYLLRKYRSIACESDSLKCFIDKSLFCVNVATHRKMLKQIARCRNLDPQSTVYYTFWFDYATAALAEMRCTFISRAHGYDIYDTRYGKYRLSTLRNLTLSRITALYPASQAGLDYIDNLYPGHRDKMHMRLLGSVKKDKTFITRCHTSADNAVTILSTARVSPEKRVLLNLDFVKSLALSHPAIAVKWIHVGDGQQMKELRQQCSGTLPNNLEIDLKGKLSNNEIHRIYHEETIDWTLLLSESEGGSPITICESFSYGVPVIATKVGGVPCMFTDNTGLLVSPDASPDEIVKLVSPYIGNDTTMTRMKQAAREQWENRFDGETLRREFAKEIAGLIKKP